MAARWAIGSASTASRRASRDAATGRCRNAEQVVRVPIEDDVGGLELVDQQTLAYRPQSGRGQRYACELRRVWLANGRQVFGAYEPTTTGAANPFAQRTDRPR